MFGAYSNDVLLISRFAVVGLFGLSALHKITGFKSFRESIKTHLPIRDLAAAVLSTFLVIGELFVITSVLIGGSWLQHGLGLALTLLVLYSVALTNQMASGQQGSCNCFYGTNDRVSPASLLRNLLILSILLAAMLALDGKTTAQDQPIAPGRMVALSALAVCLVAGIVRVPNWLNRWLTPETQPIPGHSRG